MNDVLRWLQHYYTSNCNGDWEHTWGIKIDTLDNPGWSVQVDLQETPLANQPFEPFKEERSDQDWVHCWVADNVFYGVGGTLNLSDILVIFRDWHTRVQLK